MHQPRILLASLLLGILHLAPLSADEPRDPQHSGLHALKDQPALALIGNDVEAAPILYPVKAAPQERQAAEQLAVYLSRISGGEFSAAQAPEGLPERAVLVGAFEPPAGNVSREGFVIRMSGQRLYLYGGSPRATLYAAFCLLEEQLGCRWWSYNEENVPRTAAITVVAQDTHIEPAFRIHDLFNREGQTGENFFAYKRRGKSGTSFTAVHNLCPMLKPHAEQHPEFLPVDKDGERKFNNIHMNYTAAGMPEVVARHLGDQVVRRKNNLHDFFYFAGMGDWYGGMDFSPESRRVYEQETWTDPDGRKKPGYCATVLRMVNRAAELLEKEHPGVTVGTHAYMSLEAPPAITRPRDNVIVEIPRLRHDTVRSILESEKNQSFRRNLDRWCELAPGRIYIWEYGTNFNNFIKPFPCLRSLAANIKYYHQVGVNGVRIQGNYVSHGGDLVVLKNYVWGKLLWDPTRDVDQLVQEFCTGYYGPAAEELIAYVNLLEGSVRGETPVSADEFEKNFEKWLRPEIVQQAEVLFARALKKTSGQTHGDYQRRVKEAQAGLEAFHLWNPGELREQGERLIRADLDEDSLPRARALIENCRRASPREWGDGRAYRLGLLTMHGGPLPTLKAGSLAVKVAPLQDGRIRTVMLDDAIAIDESRHVLNPGSRLYELTGREGNRVEMRAELGIAHWGSSTKQIADRTVELAAGDTIVSTGSITLASGSRQTTNEPAVQSVYHCGDQPGKVVVEYQNKASQWIVAKVDAVKREYEIPQAAELRITRKDRRIVVRDSYESANRSVAVVEYLPPDKNQLGQVRITVSPGKITVAADQPTTYVKRTLRVSPLE